MLFLGTLCRSLGERAARDFHDYACVESLRYVQIYTVHFVNIVF